MYEALTGILALYAMYVLIYNVILYFSRKLQEQVAHFS